MLSENWDCEDLTVEMDFLADVEQLEQRDMIRQKRLAAEQLRSQRKREQLEIIGRKRLAAEQLRMHKRLMVEERNRTIEIERIARENRKYGMRVIYFRDQEEAAKQMRAKEAELVLMSDVTEDVLLTMSGLIDDVEMLEAVEFVAQQMDINDGLCMAMGVDSVNVKERSVKVKDREKKSKIKEQKNGRIEAVKTRTSVRVKRTK